MKNVGTPQNAPSLFNESYFLASSYIFMTIAFRSGFTFSARWIAASTASETDISLLAIASAIPVASRFPKASVVNALIRFFMHSKVRDRFGLAIEADTPNPDKIGSGV